MSSANLGAGPGSNSNSLYSAFERRRVIVAACAGWGLEYYDFMILALCAPEIMKSLDISAVTYGSLFTVQLIATMLGGILFGWLADIYGRKRTLTWTILLFSLSTGAIYFWHTITGFVVLRFLTGLGTGGEWAIGFALLNEAWVPKKRGLAGGFVQGSLFIGYALAILSSTLVSHWTIAFALGALPALAALWVRAYTPESKQWLTYMERKRNNDLPPEIQRQAKHTPIVQLFLKENSKLVLLTTLMVFGGQFIAYVAVPYTPVLLREYLRYPKETASMILYAGTVIMWGSYILAGWLSDRFGRRTVFKIFAGFHVLTTALFTVLVLFKADPVFIVADILLCNLGFGYFGLYGVWLGELFSTRIRTSASSFAYSVGKGLACFAPIWVGMIAKVHGYGLGFSIGVFGALLAFIVAIFIKDYKGRPIEAVE